MTVQDSLLLQNKLHPSLQPQDVVKLCYQAAFGGEHLLKDKAIAQTYLMREFSAVPAENAALYEEISPEICRVSLPSWKGHGLPP